MTDGSKERPLDKAKPQERPLVPPREIPRLPNGYMNVLHPLFYHAIQDRFLQNTGITIPVDVIQRNFYVFMNELLIAEVRVYIDD
jgi:hypothetical protein